MEVLLWVSKEHFKLWFFLVFAHHLPCLSRLFVSVYQLQQEAPHPRRLTCTCEVRTHVLICTSTCRCLINSGASLVRHCHEGAQINRLHRHLSVHLNCERLHVAVTMQLTCRYRSWASIFRVCVCLWGCESKWDCWGVLICVCVMVPGPAVGADPVTISRTADVMNREEPPSLFVTSAGSWALRDLMMHQ